MSALDWAIEDGHIECMRCLIASGAVVDDSSPGKEETALMTASREGHEEIVQLLLDSGADVNSRSYGWRGGDDGAAEAFMHRYGAMRRMCAGSAYAVTRLMEAQMDRVQLLELEDYDSDTDYYSFAEWCRQEAAGTDKGWTPLMFAANEGHAECVQRLLTNNANPLLESMYGFTAKKLAVGPGVRELLAAAEADWQGRTVVNRVARGYAARKRVRAMRMADLVGALDEARLPILPDETLRLIGEMAYSLARPGSSGPRARVLQLRLRLREPFASCVTCGACAGAPQCAPCRVKGLTY